MSREFKTFLISVIAFAALLSAVAMWYDTLKIKATVETGSVDIEIRGRPLVYEGEEYGKKWVASCKAALWQVVNEDEGNPTGNNDYELVITVENAYPCYYCKVYNVEVYNSGTVPVKLEVKVYIYYNGNSHECVREHVTGVCEYRYRCDADGNGVADLLVWGCFTALEGLQLEAGWDADFTVDMHVEQDAEEGATYVVQILIKGIQWNEA